MRVLYIHDTTSKVRYRREVLRELLEADRRFLVENVCNPSTYEEMEGLYTKLESDAYDIVLASNPFWLDGTNGRAVAGIASKPGRLMAYDLSDNWEAGENSVRLMRLSDFVGASSRYLEGLARMHCPNVGLYPNGVRCKSVVPDNSFTTTSRYVYSGQLRKLDLEALDRLMAIDPDGEADIYAIDHEENGEAYRELMGERCHVMPAIPYDMLMARLHAYRYGLAFFIPVSQTMQGMLPDKYFDYCQAGIPTLFSNCGELAHEDFRKTAFDINACGFSLDGVAPAGEDFKAVCDAYNMERSLKRFINDMALVYADKDRKRAVEKTWTVPWEEKDG